MKRASFYRLPNGVHDDDGGDGVSMVMIQLILVQLYQLHRQPTNLQEEKNKKISTFLYGFDECNLN